MKQKTKKHGRIANRTVLFNMISSIALGLACLLLGLNIYANSLMQQSITNTRVNAARAAMAAQKSGDTVQLASDVMAIYDSLTPEQRNKMGTEEYRQYFHSLESVATEGGASNWLSDKLLNNMQGVSAMYAAALDKTNGALVCLADADHENPKYPGEWFAISDE